jgi:hypothetical protein
MLSDYLRDPAWAALISGFIVILYIYAKAHINNEGQPKTSQFAKPASLVALLVFWVVQNGTATRESIMTDPF